LKITRFKVQNSLLRTINLYIYSMVYLTVEYIRISSNLCVKLIIISVGREQSDLTYNKYCSLCHRLLFIRSLCSLPTTLSAAAQTIVEREQSDLIDNTTYCYTECCRKGA